MSDDLVLVTGASGYIACHLVQQLQQAGYRVRGTVRSLSNTEKVKPLRGLCPSAKYPLELVEADLTKPEGWLDAVKDCTYVQHTASPFPAESPRDENEVIKPAVEGTLNVMKACKEVKTVKRVVLTSSIAAIEETTQSKGEAVTEEHWTDLSKKGLNTYYKSKTLAEKAAWDFVKEFSEDDDGKFELVVINPSFVIGPVLCGSFSTSMEIPKRLLHNEMLLLPKLNFSCIDVRDVAAAHVIAMTSTEAAGHRHLLANGNYWIKDFAEIIHSEFTSQGYKIARKEAPYPFLWVYGLFDKSVKMLLPMIGVEKPADNTRMKTVLGIKPIDIKDSLLDMCYSMIEAGKAKKTTKYTGPRYSAQPSR